MLYTYSLHFLKCIKAEPDSTGYLKIERDSNNDTGGRKIKSHISDFKSGIVAAAPSLCLSFNTTASKSQSWELVSLKNKFLTVFLFI